MSYKTRRRHYNGPITVGKEYTSGWIACLTDNREKARKVAAAGEATTTASIVTCEMCLKRMRKDEKLRPYLMRWQGPGVRKRP